MGAYTDWIEREAPLAEGRGGEKVVAMAEKVAASISEEGADGITALMLLRFLRRMISLKPLTEITEADEWRRDGELERCVRCSSMTRKGRRISDQGRCIGTDIDSGMPYWDEDIEAIVDSLYPIELPYYPPTEPEYKVFTRVRPGFDGREYIYVQTPTGKTLRMGQTVLRGERVVSARFTDNGVELATERA